MITVTIGGMSVPLDKAGEGWVNQMIEDSRKRGVPLCVQVAVSLPGIQLALSTPGCGGSLGGSRQATPTEARIIDAWNRHGLGAGTFAPGDLRAFLNDLARLT